MLRHLPGSFFLVVLILISAASAQFPSAAAELPLTPARSLEFDVDEGTWISLDVSPDGKSIVFELLGDLYRMDSKGGTAQLISGGLPFDSQPAYSPDGLRIAFVSDRSGNENLWIANPDGSAEKQLSRLDDSTEFISPAWSADGHFVYVSRYKPDVNAFEIWRYDAEGGAAEPITHAKTTPEQPREYRSNALGAVASPDGRYLYYAAKTGPASRYDPENIDFPLWHIARRNLSTGTEETVVIAQGSAIRPVLSPDGSHLVYATRLDGETGLRLRDLATGTDRWLLYPVQHDEQEASASRDLMPRYAFMPDGRSLVLSYGGKIRRLDIATGQVAIIPFAAHVKLPAGPPLRVSLKDETGPVRARIIQWPSQSPDGQRLLFSAFGHIYTMDLSGGQPQRLTASEEPEFQPSWSPDGRHLVFQSNRSGNLELWSMLADGSKVQQLTFTGRNTQPNWSWK